MKKNLLLLAGSIVMISCNSNQKSSQSDSTTADTSKTKTEVAATEPKADDPTAWTYKTDTDKMTSKQRYFATIDATNKLEFDSPYEGGSTALITLRNQNNENEVLLGIDKGQFNCDITDGCAINVRFDSNPAIKFTGSEPSDGSSTVLFVAPAKKFLSNLKKADKMIVQAEFYESGLKTMEFTVKGLKWNH